MYVGNVRTYVLIEVARVRQGGVDVSWTLIFCFLGVTQEWISSVFEMSNVFWIAVLSLCSSWSGEYSCPHMQKIKRRPGEWWLVNNNSLHMISKTWWLQHTFYYNTLLLKCVVIKCMLQSSCLEDHIDSVLDSYEEQEFWID